MDNIDELIKQWELEKGPFFRYDLTAPSHIDEDLAIVWPQFNHGQPNPFHELVHV